MDRELLTIKGEFSLKPGKRKILGWQPLLWEQTPLRLRLMEHKDGKTGRR